MKRRFGVALWGSAFSLGVAFAAVTQVATPPWGGTLYPYGASIREGDNLNRIAACRAIPGAPW